jgi:D-tyrosyl-tRNA(Tyr) deacylase
MRALLQRVTEAEVACVSENGGEETLAAIGAGLVVLVCAEPGDDGETVRYFARKVANMRIFEDAGGKVNLSVLDVGGQALVVSQFTLAADWKKGNRPGFSGAADPQTAERLYLEFADALRSEEVDVATGRFRSHMRVKLVNDGPFTIWMDSN